MFKCLILLIKTTIDFFLEYTKMLTMENLREKFKKLADNYHAVEVNDDVICFLKTCEQLATEGYYETSLPEKYNNHYLRELFLEKITNNGLIINYIANKVKWD